MKVAAYLTPLTTINSKWIKDTNVGPKIMKLLEENIGGSPCDIDLGNDVLDGIPKAQVTKARIKLKSFCTARETANKMQRPPAEWEKIFGNHIAVKGLISKM